MLVSLGIGAETAAGAAWTVAAAGGVTVVGANGEAAGGGTKAVVGAAELGGAGVATADVDSALAALVLAFLADGSFAGLGAFALLRVTFFFSSSFFLSLPTSGY